MVELYHWEPNGLYLKPLIALYEKGVAFTSHYVDPTDPNGEGMPLLNLEAEVNLENSGPILVDQGEAISESFFMLEYIEDAYPQAPKLLPGDPAGNWRVRVWGRFLGERTAPAVSTLGCEKFLAPRLAAQSEAYRQMLLERQATSEMKAAWRPVVGNGYTDEELSDSKRKAGEAVARVEEALGAGDWLLGAIYSIADIEAFALLNAMPKLLPDACNAGASPRTIAWLERMRARPAVIAALAMARTATPDEAFAPGPEHARWG
jgi:glutathione S-transferase